MADPLSSATRATKRNLLIASVLAISANAFNVSIDKIPLAGLSVNFDDRLFAFLLVLTLIYFLCTFVLYYFIDIKNLEPTGHQGVVEQEHGKRLAQFPHSYGEKVRADLQTLAPPAFSIATTLSFSDKGVAGDNKYKIPKNGTRHLPGTSKAELPRSENEAVYAAINSRLDSWNRRYPKAFAANRRRAAATVNAVRATYAIRNYFFDGALPALLGIFALVAILGKINLHWIQQLLPSFKVLSP